ncbi:MAG: hypothetical protein WC008_04750, partial [Bacilli bacterium]
IILLVAILIPVLSATFIGIYSYNRYTPFYFDEYMDEAPETTYDKAHAFLKYTTDAYEKDPYFNEDVMKDGDLALTFEVYRSVAITTEKVDGEDVTTNKIVYHFAMYNINYNKLFEIKDPTGEDKLLNNNIPQVYIKITDLSDDDNVEVISLGVPNNQLFIDDYNASPSKDYVGNNFTNKYLGWATFEGTKKFSKNVKIEVLMSDKPEDEFEALYYSVITQFEKNDFENSISTYDSFEDGFSNDYKAAGYFEYIFKKQLWWHISLALVGTGFVSFMFYVVWNYEEEQFAKKKTKK